jgi:hypothetical protein
LTVPDAAASEDRAASSPDTSWVLGQLSRKYETGGHGPGTISSGVGDPGGVSYGSYQMSSKPNGGTVATFVSRPDCPWRGDFAGLTPGGSPFSQVWARIAEQSPDAFDAAQHDFIKSTHFDPLVATILSDDGCDVTQHSPALQDVVWSTAVQFGPNTPVIHRAFDQMRTAGTFDPAAGNFDRNAIIGIYAERGRRDPGGALVYFRSSSPAVQNGVARRYESELQDALQMLAEGAQGNAAAVS